MEAACSGARSRLRPARPAAEPWPCPPGRVTHPLLVIGDDAADEAGVGIAERGHQATQGLLVELPHRPEHPAARAAARWTIPEAAHLLQPHDALHCGGAGAGSAGRVRLAGDQGPEHLDPGLHTAHAAHGPGGGVTDSTVKVRRLRLAGRLEHQGGLCKSPALLRGELCFPHHQMTGTVSDSSCC